jgi:4-aminobutyrate aminotransferase-like enzyme
MFAHRVLINACNDDTVRFLPPLVIEEENLREGIAVLRRSLSELEKREA